MRRGRCSCFLVFTRSQAKNRRTEHDFLLGRSWRCGGFFVVGRWCFIMAPGTRRTVSGPGYWWIPETVPLSSRENALENRGHLFEPQASCVPCSPTHSPGSQEEAMPLESGTRVRRRSCAGGWEIWKREKRKKRFRVGG